VPGAALVAVAEGGAADVAGGTLAVGALLLDTVAVAPGADVEGLAVGAAALVGLAALASGGSVAVADVEPPPHALASTSADMHNTTGAKTRLFDRSMDCPSMALGDRPDRCRPRRRRRRR
jgi:hypothetical protein